MEEIRRKKWSHSPFGEAKRIFEWVWWSSGWSGQTLLFFNILEVWELPFCVSSSLWFGFISSCQPLGTECFFCSSCRPNCTKDGSRALNTVDMLYICARLVPARWRPVIELNTEFTGGDGGHSPTTEPSCEGEAGQDGYWMGGWVGTSWKLLRHGPDIPIPHTEGGALAQSGALYLDTENLTGLQIMSALNCCCLTFGESAYLSYCTTASLRFWASSSH